MIPDVTVAYEEGLLITEEHKRQMRGNKSAGWIYLAPADFLRLTTTGSDRIEEILGDENLKTLDEYNDFAREGKNILPPFLYVEMLNSRLPEEYNPGEVRGHEGRHRAAACINAGVKEMPVFIVGKIGLDAVWRLPKDEKDKNVFRFVGPKDFDKKLLGQFNRYVEVPFPADTWHSLY